MKGIYFCFYYWRSCYLYILQVVCFYFVKNKYCCCYSHNYVKILKSPGILSKVLERSWNFDAKSPGKSEKKSWKVLEFESIFLVGTMWLFNICWLLTLVLYIWFKQVLSAQTLSTWLICTMFNFKDKLKNKLSFLGKCLILHSLFEKRG